MGGGVWRHRDVTVQPLDTVIRLLCAEGMAGMGQIPYEMKCGEKRAYLMACACFG